MTRTQKESSDPWVAAWAAPAIALAACLIGLGALSIMSGNFGYQWQPVAASIPNRAQWAMAIGIVEVLTGIALIIPGTQQWGAFVASALYVFWELLHSPDIVSHPANVAAWLGASEPFAIALGALLLARSGEADGADILDRIFVQLFGASAVVFGASHFAYAQFTAAMVPAWLPMPLALAYVTGAIHAGTGSALILGLRRELAALIEAAMMTSFVLLVHIPRVFHEPSNRFEWTMMFAAIALSSAAWIVARHLHARRA